MRFAGKIALVTGAASGVGEAIVRRLASEGARVVLIDMNSDGGGALERSLVAGGGQALFLTADVSDAHSVAHAIEKGLEHFGGLDFAVNNAGINGGPKAPIWAMPDEQWRRTMAVNLDSVFYCLRAEMSAMLGRGGSAIVNIGSIMGEVGMDGIAHYVASKHGLSGLTKVAAIDGGPHNIRVNAVAPTFLRTALTQDMPPEIWDMLRAGHPLDRLPSVDEVAALTCFLLSDEAASITGSVHMIDAGWTAQ